MPGVSVRDVAADKFIANCQYARGVWKEKEKEKEIAWESDAHTHDSLDDDCGGNKFGAQHGCAHPNRNRQSHHFADAGWPIWTMASTIYAPP